MTQLYIIRCHAAVLQKNSGHEFVFEVFKRLHMAIPKMSVDYLNKRVNTEVRQKKYWETYMRQPKTIKKTNYHTYKKQHTCGCKTGCSSGRCGCRNHSMFCNAMCGCGTICTNKKLDANMHFTIRQFLAPKIE